VVMKNNRLLVAEDDRVVLGTLADGLRDAGYEVITATNGIEAAALCKQEAPDLAILDHRMPGLSGVEVAAILRTETQVPFLFLSAYGDPEIVDRATQEGALGYIVKPIDLPQILPMIHAALARGQQIQQLQVSETNLNQALAERREISIAVGVLMERRQLVAGEAFDSLRDAARSQRRKMGDVAGELVEAVERINTTGRATPSMK